MFLRQIPDSALAQYAYLIGCQRSGEAILIDPERDLDRYFAIAEENGLKITSVAETHIHADYLSGAREAVERHGLEAWLSAEGGPDWQFEWAKGNPAAHFLHHGESFRIGRIEIHALHTPGHTPEHLSFLVTDHGGGAHEPLALLSGDFLFVGDVGRPDLLESAAGQAGAMEPSARTLYDSLRLTEKLPAHLQILPGHGAGSACGKALGAVPSSVLGYERLFNGALREALHGTRDEFVRDILAGQPEPPRYFARMKRDNRQGPALLPDGKLPEPRRISPKDLASWIDSPNHAILDLRSNRADFMKTHLQGALFAPLPGGKLPIAAGSYLEENARILLVVENPAQVPEAVRQLIRIGLDHIEAWIPLDEAKSATDHLTALPRIPTSGLHAAMEENEGAVVLDVRGSDEFAAGHVDGALNIPHTRLAARLDEVPADKPLLVHCGGGLRAALAASFLANQGRDIIHVDGPFEDISS